ncbi:hypothetical protein Bca4012_025211 [Brassica carinata]
MARTVVCPDKPFDPNNQLNILITLKGSDTGSSATITMPKELVEANLFPWWSKDRRDALSRHSFVELIDLFDFHSKITTTLTLRRERDGNFKFYGWASILAKRNFKTGDIVGFWAFTGEIEKIRVFQMDMISFLPDDFLLQILSLLPTKDVLTTSVLSKRWRYLWKLVHKLEYTHCDRNADDGRFVRFVDRSLLLSTAPILESLQFNIRRKCSDVDIGFWIGTAVERGLRELSFDYWPHNTIINEPSKLPQSLFTCGSLVVLILNNVSLVDVTFPVCFHLLKTLHLICVIYLDDETPQKLLSSCKILQDLVVHRVKDDNVTIFSIMVPSLQKLDYNARFATHDGVSEFVMNAPSLKFLEINDCSNECMVEKMPELVAANVEAIYWNTDNMLSSFTSLKRLSFCLPEERHGDIFGARIDHWDEPSSIPKSLMISLETLEWTTYRGWQVEKELATFILKHSRRLKTATISPRPTSLEEKHRMLTELALLSRGSTTCQLVVKETDLKSVGLRPCRFEPCFDGSFSRQAKQCYGKQDTRKQ